MWQGYKLYDHFYTYDQVGKWFNEISSTPFSMVESGKKVEYYNMPASFDIETSTALVDDKYVLNNGLPCESYIFITVL